MNISDKLLNLQKQSQIKDVPSTLINNLEIPTLSNSDNGALDQIDSIVSLLLYDNLNNKISDEGFLIQFKNTHEKINPIEKMVTLLTQIEGTLQSKNIPTLRAWVRKIKNTHPNIDVQIQNLVHYQPTSEDIGSRVLGYSQDTQSLDLEDWRTDQPKPLRLNLSPKIDLNVLQNINSSYQALNNRFVQNISNEFFDERNRRPFKNYAHDYHLAGDISWWEDHIFPLQPEVYSQIQILLQDGIRLINYINPINTSVIIGKDNITIMAENSNVTVNLKGNVIKPLIKAIDEKVITPIITPAVD